MGITIEKRNLPVQFEQMDSGKDDRFQKVKIWIAHTGQNLNYTVFSKDVLGDMSKTLPYVPIVGFMEKNSEEENDFSDHRQRITVENSKVEVEYMGKAYGFIPEEPNAQFETRGGKEWLTCEGYLWTKFAKAIEIFDRADGSKSQSMEIDNVEGKVDDRGRLVFSKGRFSALCILGEDVNPAMAGSTIEYFSTNELKEMVREMIHQFSIEKGAEGLENNDEKVFETETDEVVETEEQTVENAETEVEAETTTEEFEEVEVEVETEDIEFSEDSDKEDDEKEEDEEGKADFSEEENESVYSQFEFSEMSYEKRRRAIQKQCYENELGYVVEMYSDYVITNSFDWDTEEYKHKKCKYTIDALGNVEIGETTEVFAQFLTAEEVAVVENYNAKIEQLESELSELRQFKADLELSEKQEVLNTYSEKLTADEVKSIEAMFSELDVEQVKDKIGALLFRKVSKPVKKEKSGMKLFSIEKEEKLDGRYGELDRFFK